MSWHLARRLITAVLAVSALALAACSSTQPQVTPVSTASPASTATTSPSPLTGTATVTRRHPITGTTVGVLVSTVPGARITVVAHFEAGDRKKTARADSTGLHKFWFSVGSAPPGVRVTVVVRMSAHGQKHSARVWFSPRQPPTPPAPKVTTAPAPPPQPSGCYPIASTGNCYEPGEFCPHADAGMTGLAGDGETIICEDNNGLRWEPA
ncbi:MAG TPA: hypothetical protein VEC76_16155 [Streptosporangiaceae bacterium]|nr:hypothetical protein [Streptosporangiaceae bacterium]